MSEWTVEAAGASLREKFAPWIQDLGLQVEAVSPGEVRLRLPFDVRLTRAGGMICGQALMSVADTAMAFAVASRMGGFVEMATVGQAISFFRAAAGKDVLCVVRLLRLGRTLAFGEAVLFQADRPDEPVAKASITYALAGPK